jgi:hypothetical protein
LIWIKGRLGPHWPIRKPLLSRTAGQAPFRRGLLFFDLDQRSWLATVARSGCQSGGRCRPIGGRRWVRCLPCMPPGWQFLPFDRDSPRLARGFLFKGKSRMYGNPFFSVPPARGRSWRPRNRSKSALIWPSILPRPAVQAYAMLQPEQQGINPRQTLS